MTFTDLNLSKSILQALSEKGYEEPTSIQEQAIPHILDDRDILGCAQTGTGKTAAFSLPIIQKVNRYKELHKHHHGILSLIVSPTRELALQIDESIRSYSKYTNIKHTVIFGGVNQNQQVRKLQKGIDILTATPGRLLDLIQQGFVDLSQVKFFVLDEADRMLDMGFIHDIRKIIDYLPRKRQSLFFSATIPDNIITLSQSILTNPVKIEVSPETTTADTVQQYIYYTNKQTKNDLLLHILEDDQKDQVLLFSRTKHGANRIARNLSKKKIRAAAIHGDRSQNQRQQALKDFKQGKVRVLVATDIASRGIDIDKLRYVINYDIPNESETYVHRIGRSGRAGEEGIAISISEPEENAFVRDIEKLIQQKIEVVDENPFPQTEKPMTAAERKEWNKEKARRRQAFFANRKKGKQNGSKNGQSRRKSKHKR
ncbi:DEAD/DEAH box helicase [Membranicola marinus]|uniref:DEAD-box ATP-dependent RNA helicase RhpA n=1 Tax=Membranihabitans marinus TaxID=1227546 RepID=A0A953HSL3_9BACT|nr:DEAD/DEAH box helicase [Membranihabitans marinus]MBY5957153.1 DEAD/DEAH box helicase [Membranihabitans marinus]